MADDLFSKKPPIPPPLPSTRQVPPPLPGAFSAPPRSAPPLPNALMPAGQAPHFPAAPGFGATGPAGSPPDKDVYDKKIAELEKRVQEEREKTLLASLKNEQESATAAKVEASLQELQGRLRRDRREQEQEEARLKLEAKIQELEKRAAQERETWVATLKNQMQSKDLQEKEFETHFAARLQELERKNLEEKAQWQKIVLAKDEENRNLRSLCEKLKGVDAEFSRAISDKKWLESRLSEMREEQAHAQAKTQALSEREKELAVLRLELSTVKQQASDLKEKLDRESSRIRQDYESEVRRVKADVAAEIAKHKDAADQSYSVLQKFKGVCAALERQSAALKSELVRKTNDLHAQRAKLENISRIAEHERDALREMGRHKQALQKALESRKDSLTVAESLAKEFENKLGVADKEKAELAGKLEGLERVASAQAAQIQNLEMTNETLRGQIAKESHLAAYRLKENEGLEQKLAECRKSAAPPIPPAP